MKNASNKILNETLETIGSVIYNTINGPKMQKLFDKVMEEECPDEAIALSYSQFIKRINMAN